MSFEIKIKTAVSAVFLVTTMGMSPLQAQAVSYSQSIAAGGSDPNYIDFSLNYSEQKVGATPDAVSRSNGAFTNSASTSAQFGGSATVYAQGNIDGFSEEFDAYNTTMSEASINYFFRITGPTEITLPYNVKSLARLSATASGGDSNSAYSLAILTIREFGTDIINVDLFAESGTTSGWNFSETINFVSGRNYEVSFFTGAYTTGRGSASGFVDPQFTLDPLFVAQNPSYAALFTLVGVPTGEVTPPGGVPEPASWAMLIAGFGLVGGVTRLRRRRLTGA